MTCHDLFLAPNDWVELVKARPSSKIQVSLGGSWVVIRGVIRPLIWVVIMVTPRITAHEPPSKL